jgi:hypothetical protein
MRKMVRRGLLNNCLKHFIDAIHSIMDAQMFNIQPFASIFVHQ